MTCEDACNFDCHIECYDWTKEQILACRTGTILLKRDPGFKKVTLVRDEMVTHKEMVIEMQFCNSCDILIDFNATSYYTCAG